MSGRSPAVVKRPQAVVDIYRHAEYLADRTSLAVAKRFLKAVEQAVNQLAKSPGLGTLWGGDDPRLAEMRFSPVGRFRNHLIFYRPLPEGGVMIVRVLHGAQDIEALFDAQD